MRVLIADDQRHVRSALRLILQHNSRVHAVDEVEDLESLFQKLRQRPVDLVLLDWELSDGDGSVVDTLHALCPHLRVIALSGRPEAREPALRSGADAFVSKGDPPERLLEAVRTLSRQRQPNRER